MSPKNVEETKEKEREGEKEKGKRSKMTPSKCRMTRDVRSKWLEKRES